MTLSNRDTEENRKALREWVREQGYDTVILHGYNHVEHAILADYDGIKLESDGKNYKIKMKIDNYIPMSQEFVAVFIPDTKEFNNGINHFISQFFSDQTSIGDSARDETAVLRQIEKSNREYRQVQSPIKTVECFINIAKIAKKKGKTTIEGYIEDKARWLEVESISAFTDERQVVIMPFDTYMDYLKVNDMEKYDQIIEDREQKEKERLGTI